jgi:hypothetical protein
MEIANFINLILSQSGSNQILETLPNDIIILICQYIDEYECCSIWHEYHPTIYCCCSIRALYLTSKRFHFLSQYKYLLPKHSQYDTTFTCVNHLGKQDGPQYIIYEDKYSGYTERYNGITTKQIRAVMAKSNEGYYVINEKVYEFECASDDIEQDIYDKICGKIYEKFNDKEILDFIWEKNCDKKTLIRKQFPAIDCQNHLRHIKLELASRDNQIFALDKYTIDESLDESIQCKKILDRYGIGASVAYRNKYHYPDRGILIKYGNDHFIYILDFSQENKKISYQEVSSLYLLSPIVTTSNKKNPTNNASTKCNKRHNEIHNKIHNKIN